MTVQGEARGSGSSGDWRHQAVCRGVDPELFFPVGTQGPAREQTAAAKAVCARCPVRARCLEFALVAIPEGVAGGLSELERAAVRRRGVAVGSSPAWRELAGGVGRLPAGVDGLVVAALVAGRAVVGASREERACAAVVLRRAGRGVGEIAALVGVGDQQVRRWLARERAGRAAEPAGGRSPRRRAGLSAR